MRRRAWLFALCLLAPCAHAGLADELYLEVSVNAEATGKVMRFTQGVHGLRTSAGNLRELGLSVPGAPDDEVELASLPGIQAAFDAASQTVTLRVDAALRAPTVFDMRARSAGVTPTVSPGALFNYDLLVQGGAERATQLNGEVRWFGGLGVFSTTGSALAADGRRRALRYDSFWSRADPDTLRTVQVGDLVSSSLSWSRSMRMGGIQLRKSFELRPDLVTYPVASLAGSAALPSALELYVNGIRQFAGDVPAGPYVLDRVSGINGAGSATLVTRDALGRASTLQLPLYVDTRMLARGVSAWSGEIGLLRRGFGQRSFGYGPAAASASGRYGLNDRVTLEGHGEFARGLAAGGGGVLLGLRQAGVLNANLTGNSGGGLQYGAGYQYVGRGVGIDVQGTRANARMRDLAALEGSTPVRSSSRLSLSKSLGISQSVSLAHARFRYAGVAAASVASLSYAGMLGRRVFLNASAFSHAGTQRDRGAYVNLTVALGQISSSFTAGRQDGVASRALAVAAPVPYGGGAGWALQTGTQGRQRYGQVQGHYLGRLGQLSATLARHGQQQRIAAEASGALVFIDGALTATRQVGSGFAMVSTGLPGIPVVHENRPVGVTNGRGHLLVPNLNPFGANRLSIDGTRLPADARIALSELTVAPRHLSGVVVRFPVERYRAASVVLHDGAGAPLPPGLVVRHQGSGTDTVTGFDGLAFVEQLEAENVLEVGPDQEGRHCVARFTWRKDEGQSLQQIGPLRCERKRP